MAYEMVVCACHGIERSRRRDGSASMAWSWISAPTTARRPGNARRSSADPALVVRERLRAAFGLPGGLLGALPGRSGPPGARGGAFRDRAQPPRVSGARGRRYLAPVTPGPDTTLEDGTQRWIQFLQECAPALRETGSALGWRTSVGATGHRPASSSIWWKRQALPILASTMTRGRRRHRPRIPPPNPPDWKPHGPDESRYPGGEHLGEGRLDWPAVLAAIREIGYDGWQTLETAATDDPPAAAARNRSFLREQFGG